MGGDKGGGKGKSKGKGKGKGKAAGKGAPPPATGTTAIDVPVGAQVTAQFTDGQWYPANVVQVSKTSLEVKVNYAGYDSSFDAWLGLDQLILPGAKGSGKGARAPPSRDFPPVGAMCEAQLEPDGKWIPGEVVEVSLTRTRANAPVKVKLEIWLPLEAVKPPGRAAPTSTAAPTAQAAAESGTGPAIGTELTAMYSDGKWYKATVVKLRKGPTPVRVSYNGHDESSDRWVSMDEIRSKALKAEGNDAPAKGKGKGKGKNDEESKGKGKGKYEEESKGKGKGKYGEEAKGKGKGRYEEESKGTGKGKMNGPTSKGSPGKGNPGKGKGKDTYTNTYEDTYEENGAGKGKGNAKGKGKGKGTGKGKY